jgi:hypothetical protein
MIIIAPAVVLAGLTGIAAWRASRRQPKTMTPERQRIYESALVSLKEPAKLRELSAVFRKEGFPAEAEVLEKRAALRELPPDVKAARVAVFKQAVNSTNPDGIRAVANAFAGEGCYGAASRLHEHAESLLVDVLTMPLPELDRPDDDEVASEAEEDDTDEEDSGAPE